MTAKKPDKTRKIRLGEEFDMRTGRHAGDPSFRVRPVETAMRDGQVFLRLD